MDRVADIEEAIGAHARWMSELRQAVLEARADIEVEDIRSADHCEFGKWLYGPAWSAEDRLTAAYQEAMRLHADFHEMAARVVALAGSGRMTEAYGLLYGEYVTMSGRLALGLRNWQHSLSHRTR